MPDVADRRGRPESSKTLDRGIRVLEVLARREYASGRSVTELATELGIGRPAVYRLIATLEEHHLVTRQADGRVRLGLGVSRLGAAVTPIVRGEARPILRDLADAVGATAHLTVAEGDEALALVVVEPSWTDFHVAYRTGSRHPLERGAAGRAILAGRRGRTDIVTSDSELQSGAHGMAMPVTTGSTASGSTASGSRASGSRAAAGSEVAVSMASGGGVEASVGVVSLSPLDPPIVAARLRAAAGALAAVLR